MRLNELIGGAPGIAPQSIPEGSKHTFFLYVFSIDPGVLNCTAAQFSEALAAEGVPSAAHLITGGRPVHLYDVFQNRPAFPGSTWPFAPDRLYEKGDCPAAEGAFDRWITMNVYENYTEQDIEELALGVGKVAWHFARRAAAHPVLAYNTHS